MSIYDDYFLTLDNYFINVKENIIKLSEIEDMSELETYITIIYHTMMKYIGLDDNSIEKYIIDFTYDDIIDVKGKTNEQILKEIRDDVLNEFKKDLNFLCFEDKDRS